MQIKIVTFCKKWNDRRWSEKKVNKAIGEGVNKFVLDIYMLCPFGLRIIGASNDSTLLFSTPHELGRSQSYLSFAKVTSAGGYQ